MLMQYFKNAEVILESKEEIVYYFTEIYQSIYIRKDDLSNSYVFLTTEGGLWQDVEDMIREENMDIRKGVELVNQRTTHKA